MKLNPSKCTFGVTTGKFLGFMVSQRGIEVNLDKIQAIMELTPIEDCQGGTELEWKGSCIEQVCLKSNI